MNESPAIYPDTQPPKGWRLKLVETQGTVTGEDFAKFVEAVNDQLASNNFPRLSWQTILERTQAQGN